MIKQNFKIHIDPACDILYSSFYIEGLYKIFGKSNVLFSSIFFSEFKQNNHFLAFVMIQNKKSHKVIIDFTDSDLIDENAYGWCDVYAKININFTDLGLRSKLVAIGPSFGINIYSFPQLIYISLLNYYRGYKRIENIRKFFSNYKAQYFRPKINDYLYEIKSSNDYIFFVASLWKKEKVTNELRKNFMIASKSVDGITFEGGFAPRSKNDLQGFELFTMKKRNSIKTYIQNTKKSLVVYNTPAVLSCHGWKLAEFLAMGKAVITTPFSRVLPKKLKDGEDVLITNGSFEDLVLKIEELKNNPELRTRLEYNAKKYYHTMLDPQKVILQILNCL